MKLGKLHRERETLKRQEKSNALTFIKFQKNWDLKNSRESIFKEKMAELF